MLLKGQFKSSKNISSVVYAEPNFPVQLQDQLLPQVNDSLNMPCIAWDDLSKSVYEHQEVWNLQMCHIPTQILCHTKCSTMGLYDAGSRRTSHWNHKTQHLLTREPSMHLQALEQLSKIFKDMTNAATARTTTPYCSHHANRITFVYPQMHCENNTTNSSATKQHSNYANKLAATPISIPPEPGNHHNHNTISSLKTIRKILLPSNFSNIMYGTTTKNSYISNFNFRTILA